MAEQTNMFWIVWSTHPNPSLTSSRYPTEAKAFDSAERLANIYPDTQFFVLASTAIFWRNSGTSNTDLPVMMLVWR